MKNVVILISGRGSNMQALLEVAGRDRWTETVGARIAAVMANRPDAAGLAIADAAGVPTQSVDHRQFESRAAFEAVLIKAIDAHSPDLVVLAGFMRVLTDGFVSHYAGRLLNIHPSLLPAHAGLATHQRVIDAGVKWHGATVHYVTVEVDHGPIFAQVAVPVLPDDTEATLAARVLAEEHRLLPMAVRWHVQGRLAVADGVVRHLDGAAQWRVGTLPS
ncbi:phosphoribosylglycinamide formyltransferase [soil metagenome]